MHFSDDFQRPIVLYSQPPQPNRTHSPAPAGSPQGRPAQRKRVLAPVGFSSIAQNPVSVSSLSASATATETDRSARIPRLGATVARHRHWGRLPASSVIAAHHALQFGNCPPCPSAELRIRAARSADRVGLDQGRDLARQRGDAVDAVGLRPQLVVKGTAFSPRPIRSGSPPRSFSQKKRASGKRAATPGCPSGSSRHGPASDIPTVEASSPVFGFLRKNLVLRMLVAGLRRQAQEFRRDPPHQRHRPSPPGDFGQQPLVSTSSNPCAKARFWPRPDRRLRPRVQHHLRLPQLRWRSRRSR